MSIRKLYEIICEINQTDLKYLYSYESYYILRFGIHFASHCSLPLLRVQASVKKNVRLGPASRHNLTQHSFLYIRIICDTYMVTRSIYLYKSSEYR